jgi:two-component system sensor histidine kinase UhpB
MTLRFRVVGLIGLVLFVSVLLGALFAGYEARSALSAELRSGMAGAVQTVQSAFGDLPKSDHPQRDLRQLVATFNDNRHVCAALILPDGRRALSSRQTVAAPPPAWFRALLGPEPPSAVLAIPKGGGAVVLTPTAALDVQTTWRECVVTVSVLSGSAMVGLVLVYFLMGAALHPLEALSDAFVRIGEGDYRQLVARAGPPELRRLQRGCNEMVERLSAMSERNQFLTRQILTLQEEERAEIARDLHDEIGPHLFAANIDAQMISEMCAKGRQGEIPGQVRVIQAAIGQIQRQVRDLLGRLRPTTVTELGLNVAIRDLTHFWGARRPDIAFRFAAFENEEALGENAKEVSYRVIQEAVNNAVRHSDPSVIDIRLDPAETDALVVSVHNDGARPAKQPAVVGFGLTGMRERVAACGGALAFGPSTESDVWAVVATLPRTAGAVEKAATL